jgi:hypothetical protein
MGAVSNEFTLQRPTMYSTLFRFGYRTDELGKIFYTLTIEQKKKLVDLISVKLLVFFPLYDQHPEGEEKSIYL